MGDERELEEGQAARRRGAGEAVLRLARGALSTAAAVATGGKSKLAERALRPLLPIGILILLLTGAFGLFLVGSVLVGGTGAGAASGGDAISCTAASSGAAGTPPAALTPIYQQAAATYQLGPQDPSTGVWQGWAYLAALNNAESTFATNNGPRTGVLSGSNSAGGAAQQPRRDWGGERVGRGRLSSPVRRPSCRSPEACPERTSSIPLAEPCRFREQACRRRWNWPESPAR